MDTIRVLRIIEYTGPREEVERIVSLSIHGSKTYGFPKEKEVTIRAATLGEFPEIMEKVDA